MFWLSSCVQVSMWCWRWRDQDTRRGAHHSQHFHLSTLSQGTGGDISDALISASWLRRWLLREGLKKWKKLLKFTFFIRLFTLWVWVGKLDSRNLIWNTVMKQKYPWMLKENSNNSFKPSLNELYFYSWTLNIVDPMMVTVPVSGSLLSNYPLLRSADTQIINASEGKHHHPAQMIK